MSRHDAHGRSSGPSFEKGDATIAQRERPRTGGAGGFSRNEGGAGVDPKKEAGQRPGLRCRRNLDDYFFSGKLKSPFASPEAGTVIWAVWVPRVSCQ